MANTNTKRIIRDGFRNAVVQLTGTLDTSAATFTVAPAIDISADFIGNDPKLGTMVGLRLDKVQYTMNDDLSIELFYNATADEVLVNLAGRGKLCFEDYAGIQPDQGNAGFNGDIDMEVNNIVVAAGTPIQVYTLVLEFTKLYDVTV